MRRGKEGDVKEIPGRTLRGEPEHSFAVCAYGDSPYLEACLRSLKAQSAPSELLLCTSTPSPYIRDLAERYGFALFVREGRPGIGADWNFAMRSARGRYVTLAHQDDIYGRHYAERLLRSAGRWPDMALFTTRSATLKNGRVMRDGPAERIKRLLRAPLRIRVLSGMTAWKRSVLRFGNPVVCPSCAYRRESCLELPFSEKRKFILDWEFLYEFAKKGGRWICDERPLILYRIHEGAATARCIGERVREREEREMLRRMWPEQIAELILHFYRRAYAAYEG